MEVSQGPNVGCSAKGKKKPESNKSLGCRFSESTDANISSPYIRLFHIGGDESEFFISVKPSGLTPQSRQK
jgi:hypothetical protein